MIVKKRVMKRSLPKIPNAEVRIRPYTGKVIFLFDQIGTSLLTVAAGFLLATVIAIPVGIVLGLNQSLYQAFNPVIQLLKPVSPLGLGYPLSLWW